MRQGWLLAGVTVLFLLALSAVLPAGKAIWRDNWPEVNQGLDVAGGFRVVLRAKLETLKPDELKDWPNKRRELPRILEKRLRGATSVTEAHVVPKGADQFIVEIPGLTNSEDVIKLISTTARLEFYFPVNVRTQREPNRPYEAVEREDEEGNRVFDIKEFTPTLDEEATVYKSGSPELVRFMKDNWRLILDGSMLTKAQGTKSGAGQPVVALRFNDEGAKRLSEFSRLVSGRGEFLAIILDGEIISFPVMQAVIDNGEAVIEGGNMTGSEAARLGALLTAGALPVDLEQLSMTRVDPTIGRQALSMILFAGVLGFILVSLFMMGYYRIPGVMAVVALCVYTIFCYAVFKTIHVTFSLAGIAGFVLSIGMAVDANVLIFERMKEELRLGKTLLNAIDAGFKRAFTAIFDSNACTIITCSVLYTMGTGPVQGFAATLGIGVAISLFTAVTLTRMLLYLLVGFGVVNPVLFALGLQWFGRSHLNIVRRMWVFYTISLLVLIPGIIFLFIGGWKPGIEFKPGAEITYTIPGGANATTQQFSAALANAGFEDASVQLARRQDATQVIVRLNELREYPGLKDLGNMEQRRKIAESLSGLGVDARLVDVTQGETTVRKIAGEDSYSEVGRIISQETLQKATLALIVAIGLILIYLSVRFAIEGGWSGVKFGASALTATIHDAGVVVGAAAVFGYFYNWPITSLFLTALLTIIGFSVHDTIVIFDRIRENLHHKKKGESFDDLVDRSITQSFARSINTSFTVLVILACLLAFGSAMPELRHFNALMLIGVISGTYSSIYNASPILVLIERLSHRMGGKTLEAAVKERERRTPAPLPKAGTAAEGEGQYAQTSRDDTVAEEPSEDGKGAPRSKRPKSKKPKRRF